MLEAVFTSENLVALATLTGLEIVLGIDNVIFISILAGKLPAHQQALGRRMGVGFAVLTRILLLVAIAWIARLTHPMFEALEHSFSGRDLILLGGGLFLIGKSTFEIHGRLEATEKGREVARRPATVVSVVFQIALIDIVFSLDSVITAVGISGKLVVMIPAIIAAAAVMLVFAGAVARFVDRHPTMKILALSFLLLIGALLVVEGWASQAVHEFHLKNYAYFAMAFSFCVELLNMRFRGSPDPIRLHNQPRASQLSFRFEESHTKPG